ncbi:MAG: hypothetical protein FWE96_05910 [Coriobacteriia bacterium]|nr:hypothetical protein [Coriobacteriia bacterium]
MWYKRDGVGGTGGTGLVFQFDQGQIGTLTPSPLFHQPRPSCTTSH